MGIEGKERYMDVDSRSLKGDGSRMEDLSIEKFLSREITFR